MRERGLSGSPVTVWVYDGSLTVEYQTVTLSQYSIEPAEDRKQIKQVSHPRLAQTAFRSPQLTLLDVGPDEWRLDFRAPLYQPRRRICAISGMVQLPLFDPLPEAKAVGADEGRGALHPHTHLHLVREQNL
jgi:hypothetical protein